MLTCLNLGYGGRLANQMFQVAAIVGLAKKFGHDFAFPYWMNFEHKDRFGSDENIDVQSWFKNKLPVTVRREGFSNAFIEFHARVDDIQLSPNIDYNITQQYSGHLQSEKWFAHCADLVRHYFEFDEGKIWNHLPGFEMIANDLKEVCGIHIRVGDYAKQDSWQPVLDERYYKKAIETLYLSAPEPNRRFLVFSDDPKRAKEIIGKVSFSDEFMFVANNHYMVDLWMMTQCKHMIIGNSTFSWWGAWLSKNPDKKVVAPSRWWKPHIEAQWGYSTRDLFPESWTVI